MTHVGVNANPRLLMVTVRSLVGRTHLILYLLLRMDSASHSFVRQIASSMWWTLHGGITVNRALSRSPVVVRLYDCNTQSDGLVVLQVWLSRIFRLINLSGAPRISMQC